jgi:arsenate reductase
MRRHWFAQEKEAVLFFGSTNACRSQMAEGLLRRAAGDRFVVLSAGLHPQPIDPMAIRVMEEVGIDLRGHRPKSVLHFSGRDRFDYVISVCVHAHPHCAELFAGAKHRLLWPIDDPTAVEGSELKRLSACRRVRDRLDSRIHAWLEQIAHQRSL